MKASVGAGVACPPHHLPHHPRHHGTGFTASTVTSAHHRPNRRRRLIGGGHRIARWASPILSAVVLAMPVERRLLVELLQATIELLRPRRSRPSPCAAGWRKRSRCRCRRGRGAGVLSWSTGHSRPCGTARLGRSHRSRARGSRGLQVRHGVPVASRPQRLFAGPIDASTRATLTGHAVGDVWRRRRSPSRRRQPPGEACSSFMPSPARTPRRIAGAAHQLGAAVLQFADASVAPPIRQGTRPAHLLRRSPGAHPAPAPSMPGTGGAPAAVGGRRGQPVRTADRRAGDGAERGRDKSTRRMPPFRGAMPLTLSPAPAHSRALRRRAEPLSAAPAKRATGVPAGRRKASRRDI